MCRRATGGPFTSYALVEQSAVRFTGTGRFTAYESSDDCTRYHCRNCGSFLASQLGSTRQYKVPLARFTWHGNQIDRSVAPTHHEYYQDRVMDFDDLLPKYKITSDKSETLDAAEPLEKKRTKTKTADKKGKGGDILKGTCLCGAVTVSSSTTPQGESGHVCHCNTCKSNCGTSCVFYGSFPDNVLNYTGAENLRAYETKQGSMRYKCKHCSSLCRLHNPGRRLSFVPLALFGNVPSVPLYHQYYTNRLLDLDDDSVKYEQEKGGKALSAPVIFEE